jgi:acid phosphatase (class A)
MRSTLAVVVAAGALLAGCLAAGQTLQRFGYLRGGAAPDTAAILPAAPGPDSPTAAADRAIFKTTRALAGTPRWALAQRDVVETVPAMLGDFSCAVGAQLTPASAPQLNAIILKLRFDVLAAVDRPKALYRRQRPFLIDAGEICTPRTESLARSPDYPSGHATWGWTLGLVIAELAPDRAAAILSRARAFGESRVVCGVHNASAIEAGRTNAAALVAALHGDRVFRADIGGARAEMAGLRRSSPRPAACGAEAALTARTPW